MAENYFFEGKKNRRGSIYIIRPPYVKRWRIFRKSSRLEKLRENMFYVGKGHDSERECVYISILVGWEGMHSVHFIFCLSPIRWSFFIFPLSRAVNAFPC